MHHFFLLDSHVDGGKGITDLLNLGCVIGHRQIFLPDIVELLLDLQLLGRCASGKKPFEIRLHIF